MSKQELSTQVSDEIINSLILTGDMSKLTPAQQTQYYNAVCKSVGLNPLTQPFAIIVLQGKKTLYATKGCTQQLSDTRKINTEVKDRKTLDSIYQVSCRATMPDGRFTDDDGIVSIVGLKGADLGNAMMKAVTKAKRRAVLALCGLGMPDETEVEDMVQHPASEKTDKTKSRVENLVENQVEDAETTVAEKEPEPVKEEPKKTRKSTSIPEPEPLSVKGVIEEVKLGNVPPPNETEPKTKHSFRIGDKFYGTFNLKLAKEIMDMLDIQAKSEKGIMVKIEYSERKKGDKTFQDIITFKQLSTKDVPI